MKMLRWGLAALAVLAVSGTAVPTTASAETTVIKKVYRGDGPRAEMHRHRHEGYRSNRHRGDRVVVIKERRRHHHWR
jgi:hypothetical protein